MFRDALGPNGEYPQAETFFILNTIHLKLSPKFLENLNEERIFFIIANFWLILALFLGVFSFCRIKKWPQPDCSLE